MRTHLMFITLHTELYVMKLTPFADGVLQKDSIRRDSVAKNEQITAC